MTDKEKDGVQTIVLVMIISGLLFALTGGFDRGPREYEYDEEDDGEEED